ncbi:MAG: antirestriction protein ArdA [Ghiorsea sp.]
MSSFYVVNLRKYNDNLVTGAWVEATTDEDEMLEEIKKIADDDEWAIHDYEDLPDFGEYPNLSEIVDFMCNVDEYGLEVATAANYLDCPCEAHQGEFESMTDFAEQYLEDIGVFSEISENLQYYFDFERFAEDELSQSYDFRDGHVFSREY